MMGLKSEKTAIEASQALQIDKSARSVVIITETCFSHFAELREPKKPLEIPKDFFEIGF